MEFLTVNALHSPSHLGTAAATASLTDFAQRLTALRKQEGLTQQQLALRHEARRWSSSTETR